MGTDKRAAEAIIEAKWNVRLITYQMVNEELKGIISTLLNLVEDETPTSEISVCDSCETTYPMRWVQNNRCPLCGLEHSVEE